MLVTKDMEQLAEKISEMSWADMDKIAAHIAGEISELEKMGALDPYGIARLLNDMADDILKIREQNETPDPHHSSP